MRDSSMREFSRELLALQQSFGWDDSEFAGILIGSAATVTARAGIPKDHMLKIAGRCYDENAPEKMN